MKCQLCGKRTRAGFNVSHSNRHTKRWFRPNVRKATLVLNGAPQQVKACTRCLRTYHKTVS